MNHKYVQGPSRRGLVLYQSFTSSVEFLGVVPGVVFDVVQTNFEPDLDISDIDESEDFA